MYILGITTTRADFGLLKPTFERMIQDNHIRFELVATATHLEEEFGYTKTEIIESNIPIDHEVCLEMSKNYHHGIGEIYSITIQKFCKLFRRLKPDLIFILGDRYETHAIATAATLENIAIAHAHGGEITEGAIDDALRHSITKMSHIHFASNQVHCNRIIQMGEDPKHVVLSGALAIESIFNLPLLSKTELENSLEFSLDSNEVFLVTYHPETIQTSQTIETQINELFLALNAYPTAKIIITKANADYQGREINQAIEKQIENKPNYLFVSNLGQLKYYSLIKIATAVIGNSSSGIIEVPSFQVGTVNIGDRQKGRLSAESVIHCPCERESIKNAIESAKKIKGSVISNPYDQGKSSELIVNSIHKYYSKSIISKKFHTLDHFK